MFLHVSRNYTTVHKKLSYVMDVLENKFKPEIEKIKIDKALFVKRKDFESVKQECNLNACELKKHQEIFNKAKEEMDKQINELEAQTPKARRAQLSCSMLSNTSGNRTSKSRKLQRGITTFNSPNNNLKVPTLGLDNEPLKLVKASS